MLNLYPSQQIEGLTVFSDDARTDQFFVLPDQPGIRVDPNTKKPVFKFVKYKNPVTTAGGSKGGGFLIFDSAFVVSDDKMKKITDALNKQLQAAGHKGADGQPLKAKIGMPTFVKGTATLTLLDSGGTMVTKILDAGKPSLFGSLICSFTAELSPEGATLVEALLKGSGGIIQIAYDLSFGAVLPPITGNVWFNASKFYSFYQSIDKSHGYMGPDRENQQMRESFVNSQTGGVSFNFDAVGLDPGDATLQKLEEDINNWGFAQLDEAVKTAILPDIKASEDRGDDGQDHIKKMQSTWESSSFSRSYSQRQGITFETVQQGTLPDLKDMGFDPKDYMIEVDLNDPFFAQVNVSVYVNADFDRYAINSVGVFLEYTKTNPATEGAFHFTKADDVGHFASDTANGDMSYDYWFEVSYRDQSKSYTSQKVTTTQGLVTVSANDLGILFVALSITNVDFDKTPQVVVAITYPDNDANGQPISAQFMFDKSKKSDTMLAVLLKPVTQDYTFVVTYVMADGTQVVMDPVHSKSAEQYINSPFATRTYSFLAEADFTNSVDSIFLRMNYNDDAGKNPQSTDYTFNAKNPNHDWSISVLGNERGTITYSGVINYKDHTTENIAETPTKKDLIEFGPPNQVIVSVTPDTTLIDFSKVKLIKVDLEYIDATNKLDLKKEIVLKPGGATPTWTFYARDPANTAYNWKATYFTGATPPPVLSGSGSDTDLILMMPS